MPFKPMKLRDYQAWLRQYGWILEKGGNDWFVRDENGNMAIANIIVTHPGREVPAVSVKKTKTILITRGLEQ